MTSTQDDPFTTVPLHPEEIKSTFDLRVGRHVSLHGSARITPAGVISAGIAVAAMTFALGYVISSIQRRRS